MLEIWILIFIVSLILLIKSAAWFVESAEALGSALKIPTFILGVTIIAIGTSLPELASGLAATLKGVTNIVVANVIGSNIANIFLVLGISAIITARLTVKRSLIDLDAPLLGISTSLFLFIVWDRKVTFFEGVILIFGFLTYLLYTIFHGEEEEILEVTEVTSLRIDERRKEAKIEPKLKKSEKLNFKVFFFLILGGAGLYFGANYTIESIIKISGILKIPDSLIAILGLAIGTSLPELAVSVRAVLKKKYELALGNIFGSCVFNILLIVGIPALIRPLEVDALTFSIGLPFLTVATLLLIISGISRRIYIWEGAMYVLLYFLFIVKLFESL